MAVKPSPWEIEAYDVAQKNPNFGHDVLESIINETPELRDALLSANIVKEVKNGDR